MNIMEPKTKTMRLIKWSSVTLLLMNNWYPGTAMVERRHKVLNLSTSIICPLSERPTSSCGWGSAGTCCCSVSIWVTSLSGGHWGRSSCSSCGGSCNWLSLARSCFGVTWANTGLTLATMAAERGLAVRPRWTVSQPSASFLPGKHMSYWVSQRVDDVLLGSWCLKGHTFSEEYNLCRWEISYLVFLLEKCSFDWS